MLTKEIILSKLTDAVNGTDKVLYNEDELNKFAASHEDKFDENTSYYEIAETFVDYFRDTYKPCRRCSACGNLMREGYCVDAGEEYYCSDNCLHTEFTDEEWDELCEENDESYYTEWY